MTGSPLALEFYKGEKILSAPFFFKVMSWTAIDWFKFGNPTIFVGLVEWADRSTTE